MSKSPCTTILPLLEALPSSPCLLPDERTISVPVSVSLPVSEAVPACAVALDLPLPQTPDGESVDEHMPETPPAPLPEPGVLVSPYSRSPSPTYHRGYIRRRRRASSPALRHRRNVYEEEDDHFIRRWQQWDEHERQWSFGGRFSHSPVNPPDIDGYFCLNTHLTRKGENTSLILNNFSAVLDSLLRTVFVNADHDEPREYPIHCLFQKMGVLRSRLDDVHDILHAEQIPDDLTSKAEVYGYNASSGCDTAIRYLTDLVTQLGKLLEVVEAECKQKAKEFEESLANNQISFDLLEYYYEEGAWYVANVGDHFDGLDDEKRILLVVLKKACFGDRTRNYREHLEWDDDCSHKHSLRLEAEYLEWDGVRFQTRTNLSFEPCPRSRDSRECAVPLTLDAYQGTRPISSLFLQRMTGETLVKVTERGSLYLSYCRVFCAEYYSDTKTQNELSHSDNSVKPCVRQVIIDPFGFHHAQQGYNPNIRITCPDQAQENIGLFPYWIGGYDLDTHEWQTFRIWDLKPIEYDQEAWRTLIMDETTKDLIKALVDSTGRSLGAPYAAQRTKGKNILLKGSPGTGRMTTIHAICNLLKRPLLTMYAHDFPRAFSMRDVTEKFAERVSLAVTWNAVIVVKEADEYLESTYNGDMGHTNAVLRHFESNDCIAFWVTSGCNKAFLTSFCAVINFPELNASARRRLWLNHFGHVDPTGITLGSEHALVSSSFGHPKKMDYSMHIRAIEELSSYQLDGRVIKNIMRSARALADSNGQHLSVDHVKAVMMAQQLNKSAFWRKVTQIVMLPAKFRKLVGWIRMAF